MHQKDSLILKDISVEYIDSFGQKIVVLDKLSLNLASKKSLCIIGGNGIGKSTLIKVISGEISPSAGNVIIGGHDCTNMNLLERSHLIGIVLQDSIANISPMMTVFDHLMFAMQKGKRRGLKNIYFQKKKYLEFFKSKLSEFNVNLEDKLDVPAGFLSGGQRQLLSIAMAALSPAKVLILDEHTASLNQELAEIVMDFTIRVMHEYDMSVVMVTHNMRHIEYVDIVVTIDNKKLKYVSVK